MTNNVTTLVQNGETLSLYAKMYGCSTEELTKLNPGKIGKNGSLKSGSVLIIPIGKKPQETNKENRTVMQEKANWFNDILEEAKLKIYDPSLTSAEREKHEQTYITLLNKQKERDKAANIAISKDKMHFDLTIKENITLAEFRKLYPEVGKNFSDYADKTDQTEYKNGKGFIRDPEKIILKKGAKFTLKTQEYANKGFFSEFWTSVKKTFGYEP